MESTLPNFELVPQALREYDVPLPLVTHVRNIYTELIRKNSSQLNSLMKGAPSSQDIKSINALLNDLRKLCDHLSLNFDDSSIQQSDINKYQAKYAENISTKFIFVCEFLQLMKPHNKHIIIIIRQGALIDIIEAIFKIQDFEYCRADRQEQVTRRTEESGMRITLMPTCGKKCEVVPADIIIAFDSSYSQLSNIKDLLGLTSKFPTTILLRLIICHSVEHFEKVSKTTSDPLDDKIRLAKLISSIGSNVGTLPKDYPSPPNAAKIIAKHVLQEEIQHPWPLLPLPEIQHNAETTQETQSSGIEEIPGELMEKSSNVIAIPMIPAKRFSEDNFTEASEYIKRQKADIYLNDSSKFPENQVNGECLDKSIVSCQENKNFTDSEASFDPTSQTTEIYSENYVFSLKEKLKNLETQLCKKEEIELELRQVNKELESRRLDVEASLNVIQSKFQESINDRGLFEHEKNLAVRSEYNARHILESKQVALTKIQQEKFEIAEELKNAREAVLNSKVPEVVEFEKMRLEISALRSENELLAKQKKISQSDFDYMQTNYQAASTMAAALSRQIESQKSEIEALKIKASENSVKIHQIQRENVICELQLIIKGLRAEKFELERQIEKLSEHYSASMSGRPNTRGNSVPRSPRLGAYVPSPRPISTFIGSYSLANTVSGNRSRGSSPSASGDLATGTRTTSTGGDGNTQQRAEKPNFKRFGNHLI